MKDQKPLVTLQGAIEARVYRPVFRSFESTKYLDVAALSKVRKATIEIGTIEAPGVSWIVTAEIREGQVVKVVPTSCASCKQKRGIGAAKYRKLLREAVGKLDGYKLEPFHPPVALKKLPGWIIILGPIVVIGPTFPGNPHPGCTYVWTPGEACWFCDGFTSCVTPTDDNPIIYT